MRSAREEERLLARLDAQVRSVLEPRHPTVVAFSAGLASLLLAAVARKHGDLRCVVVGTRRAADVGAAMVARDFLDYRLDVVTPTPASILETATKLRAEAPTLTLAEVLDLVPLAFVEAHRPEATVLSGFGLGPASTSLRRHTAGRPSRSPTLRQAEGGPSRHLVVRLAREMGLPDAFIQMSHRRAAEGSGVGPTLRTLGHAHHRSVDALVRRHV